MPGKWQEVFSNTRKSTTVRQFVFGFLPIICIEFIIAGILIYFLASKGWQLLLAFALLFSLYAYAAYVFGLMLRSAHVLSDEAIYLRLTTLFKGRISLSIIDAVEKVFLSSHPKPDMIGVMCAREGETLYCLSRKSDVLRILLTEPVLVKAPAADDRKSKQGLVREILINVDEPERFLERMNRVAPVKRNLETNGSSKGVVRVEADTREKVAPQLVQAGVAETTVDTVSSVSGERAEAILEIEAGGGASIGAPEKADLLPSLEFEKLTRYYGDFPAVQNLTLKTYPGEIFGFLGANGAGKTTTIRMITGLLRPTSGKAKVQGEDLWRAGTEARRLIGYVPDTPLVYERLTAREHLMVAGRLYNLPQEGIRERTEELLSILDLQKWGDRMISTYSMGMKRKISLVLALLPDPELIIVDELTNAFDAPTLAQIKDILINLRNMGKTIFMSTHVMDVAEKICDRVGILHQGQLRALGTVDELCRSFNIEGGLEPLFLKIAAGRGVEQ